MAIRTFNIDDEVYKAFSEHCKKNGVSMSKRVENFLREEVAKINAFVKMQKDRKAAFEKTKRTDVSGIDNASGHSRFDKNGHSTFSKYC